MPRTVAAFALTLVMLTSIVFWQLAGLATTRSVPASVPHSYERLAKPIIPDSPQIVSSTSIESIEPAISPRTPRLERLTFDRFARFEAGVHGGMIIVVEAGELNARVSGDLDPGANLTVASSHPGSPGSSFGGTLVAGHTLAIPAGVLLRLSNTGLEPAIILSLTIPPFDPAEEPGSPDRPNPLPAGVSRELELSGSSIRPHHGPFHLEMRRVELSPGTSIENHRVAESELALVTEGILDVLIQHGEFGLHTATNLMPDRSGTVSVPVDNGIHAPAGTELSYHAAGNSPATFWQVTISPVE